MHPLFLDFVRPAPRRYFVGWVMLAIACLVTATLAQDYLRIQDKTEEAGASLHKMQRRIDRARTGAQSATRDGAANEEMTRRLQTLGPARWETFFNNLEAAAGDDVTLIAVLPEGSGAQLTGEAKHLTAATEYLERLKRNGSFTRAFISDYEFVKDHAQRPVRFTVTLPAEGLK